MEKKLSRKFYLNDAVTVAKKLLGKALIHNSKQGVSACIIVETEAYMGVNDRASHSFKGRKTRRTMTLYGPPGTAYVYLIYGLHHMFNVVVGEEGNPMAVLIRSGKPYKGVELMIKRRKLEKRNLVDLCKGPGNLTKALGITVEENGVDLTGEKIYIADIGLKTVEIAASRRIGVDYAGEDAEKKWRFYIKGSKYVSKK